MMMGRAAYAKTAAARKKVSRIPLVSASLSGLSGCDCEQNAIIPKIIAQKERGRCGGLVVMFCGICIISFTYDL